jgi:hypothetical protein
MAQLHRFVVFVAAIVLLACVLRQTEAPQTLDHILINGQHPVFRHPVQLHISIKTSSASVSEDYLMQAGRVAGIADTWLRVAANETWFVTDQNHSGLWHLSRGHVVASGCPHTHARAALCCKTEHEVQFFYERRLQDPKLNWFCHVDDDMYVFRDNLIALLETYDGDTERHFLGPNNFWPETTRHLQSLRADTGILHPMSVYCMSGALVDAVYPEHMAGGKFGGSCTNRPDDVALTDLVHTVAGVGLTVNNNFHQQHSVHEKLPLYNLTHFVHSAITSYGYGNLPLLHAMLYSTPGISEGESVWWRRAANLSVLSPKRPRHAALGFNYCRRVYPRPGGDGLARSITTNATDRPRAQWCGPPMRTFKQPEPLCQSRVTYQELHPTHAFTETDHRECPYSVESIPQSVGTPVAVSTTLRAVLESAYGKRFSTAAAQHSRAAFRPVFHSLAQQLAAAGTPGTCCIGNPDVSDDEGGRCYWTAYDQTLCQHTQ